MKKIRGLCHKSREIHILCNFLLGMYIGLIGLKLDQQTSLIVSFIIGLLYMVYEYKLYKEINKVNLLSVQFGSMFTIFGLQLI